MEARLLCQAGAVVTVVATLDQARQSLANCDWDLVVLDLCLADGCGRELVREAIERPDPPGVLVLSGRLDLLDPQELTHPAAMVVGKGDLGPYLVGVAHAALLKSERAARFQAPARSKELFEHFADTYELSAREREVLRLLVAGTSPKDAASALCVADATLRYHVRTTFRKCGVRNQREVLALYARTAADAREQQRPHIALPHEK
jgi:DNA-binding NarL/FixJ family response regulator